MIVNKEENEFDTKEKQRTTNTGNRCTTLNFKNQ